MHVEWEHVTVLCAVRIIRRNHEVFFFSGRNKETYTSNTRVAPTGTCVFENAGRVVSTTKRMDQPLQGVLDTTQRRVVVKH